MQARRCSRKSNGEYPVPKVRHLRLALGMNATYALAGTYPMLNESRSDNKWAALGLQGQAHYCQNIYKPALHTQTHSVRMAMLLAKTPPTTSATMNTMQIAPAHFSWRIACPTHTHRHTA